MYSTEVANAYKQTIREIEDPRDLERRVLLQVTRELERISVDASGRLNGEARIALWRNQKLWGAFLFDVCEPGNPLPKELKARIISLAMFVDSHTPEVLAGRKTVDALVAINRNLIRGLGGTSPAHPGT